MDRDYIEGGDFGSPVSRIGRATLYQRRRQRLRRFHEHRRIQGLQIRRRVGLRPQIRLSVTDAPNALADPLPDAVREILKTPSAQRTPEQEQAIFRYGRTTVPE